MRPFIEYGWGRVLFFPWNRLPLNCWVFFLVRTANKRTPLRNCTAATHERLRRHRVVPIEILELPFEGTRLSRSAIGRQVLPLNDLIRHRTIVDPMKRMANRRSGRHRNEINDGIVVFHQIKFFKWFEWLDFQVRLSESLRVGIRKFNGFKATLANWLNLSEISGSATNLWAAYVYIFSGQIENKHHINVRLMRNGGVIQWLYLTIEDVAQHTVRGGGRAGPDRKTKKERNGIRVD